MVLRTGLLNNHQSCVGRTQFHKISSPTVFCSISSTPEHKHVMWSIEPAYWKTRNPASEKLNSIHQCLQLSYAPSVLHQNIDKACDPSCRITEKPTIFRMETQSLERSPAAIFHCILYSASSLMLHVVLRAGCLLYFGNKLGKRTRYSATIIFC